MQKLLPIILCILSYISFDVNAQETNDNPSVHWISQFPSKDKKPEKFSKKIGKIIFGKEEIKLTKPFNIIAQSPELYWIADQGNGTIFQIKNNSFETPKSILKQLKGFHSLVGICKADDGSIYFTDSHLSKVYKIDFNKKKLLAINDKLNLKQPTGIAYAQKNKELWVVETALHRISILNEQGEIIKTIGKRGHKAGEFNFPTFIWIDQKGYVYIVDSMNFRIQIFNEQGAFVSTFGQIGDASGYLARPKGIATDTYGNIYIPDALFHVVQVFDQKGNFLYQFGKQGQGEGEFWMPTGIYIDENNYIYVADTYNSRIQIFQLVTGN